MKKPRTLAQLRADPRVESCTLEPPDGRWLYLVGGYIHVDGVHAIHEDTITDILREFNAGNIICCKDSCCD